MAAWRDTAVRALSRLMARATTERRYPGEERVPYRPRTVAGEIITPDTAVRIAAVWACLRYISQTVAVLPWNVKRDTEKGAEIQWTHNANWLLSRRPSDEWSSFQFRETLIHWALRWGNGFAEIEPDNAGRPFAMWPIHPDRVVICRATESERDAYGDVIPVGGLFYEITDGYDARKIALLPKRVFHLRGFGEGPVGVNVIAYAGESLGWARSMQVFAASFFGNGMNVAGVVVNKKPLKTEGLKRQKAEFASLYQGPRNANKTAFLDNDAEWKAIGIDAQKSQLIESQQHLVEEVARWFGVPPHKIMHLLRSTFNNIEHQAIEVVQDTIMPWTKRLEDEADYKLFGQNRPTYYTKINLRGLLRGDFKSQQEGLEIMRRNGAVNVNEWRELVDMNGIGKEGDEYAVQSQWVKLDQIGQQPMEPAAAAIEPDDEAAALAESNARILANV